MQRGFLVATAKSDFKRNIVNKLPWFILVAFIMAKLLWNGLSTPLVRVHWDSPAYLEYAKLFANTKLINYYTEQVSAMATQGIEHIFWDYWQFSRLGHIVLLGTVVKMFGSGAAAIVAAHWLYNILMAFTMGFAVVLVTTLTNYLDIEVSQLVVLWSAVGSAILYMTSNIYAYMGRCLVSEVPVIFLLTIAILLLIMGLKRSSVFLSCGSGFFAFVAYSVRLESIWLYISFCAVLATVLWIRRGSTQWLLAYVCAGSVSCACYLLYAWYFYPLANPSLFILFAQSPSHVGAVQAVPFSRNISAAGGLLWIGVFASIIATSQWPTARVALAWAGAALLPALPCLMQSLNRSFTFHTPIQTRMLVVILFLPLFFSSTLGWAYVWTYSKRRLRTAFFAAASLTVVLVALHSWTIATRLSMFPGFWHLKEVRELLMVPSTEQPTFQFNELNHISQVIYSKNNPGFLVYDRDSISIEHIALIRFFGPPYRDPTDATVQCTEHTPEPVSAEKFSYCDQMTTDELRQLTKQGITVFLLTSLARNNHIIMPFGYTEVLHTQHYRLGILEP
jgi:hypothetical protein